MMRVYVRGGKRCEESGYYWKGEEESKKDDNKEQAKEIGQQYPEKKLEELGQNDPNEETDNLKGHSISTQDSQKDESPLSNPDNENNNVEEPKENQEEVSQ